MSVNLNPEKALIFRIVQPQMCRGFWSMEAYFAETHRSKTQITSTSAALS